MSSVYLGCPLWAHAPWRGAFFTRGARREEFLPQYASVFPTAEGNATFYGLPTEATVERWAAEAPEGFRFCFKFPRTISHERQLEGAGEETAQFLGRVAPLGPRLGPFFLQLHERFGVERIRTLERFLDALPAGCRCAVEVRAPEFFAGGPAERRLDDLLTARRVDRVLFDTGGLFAVKAEDEATRDAQRKKPRVPRRETATARAPFVRFVGNPAVEANDPALRRWAGVARRWCEEGRTPFIFLHHPDDLHAPALARRFQHWLHLEDPARFAPPPRWPVEGESESERQLSLF